MDIIEGENVLNVQMTMIAGTLYGQVTSYSTGSPIGGVSVTVGSLSTSTDANGNYSIGGIPVGAHVVTFSKDGYETVVL